MIQIKDPNTLSPAFSEIKDGVLVDEVFLVSKSYLMRRDEREIQQLELIEKLKIKAGVP